MKRGFSLVELSIVLVILGLLTGGILAGQSLIRAAELRAAATEYQRWIAATQSFRDKYFALPGDMRNATKFWGDNNAQCADAAIANGSPGTCNGDGNGSIANGGAINTTAESFQYWNQLALAGLIEGSYTGLAGPNAAWAGNDAVVGTNVPRSRIANSGWGMFAFNSGGDANTYLYDFGNLLVLGAQAPGNYPVASNLKPEEAWNLDTKLDDGKPARGKVWVRDGYGFGNASACTTSTSATDYAGEYNLAVSAVGCVLWFARAF